MLETGNVVLATPGAGVTSANLSVGRFDELRVKTHVGGHMVTVDTRARRTSMPCTT
jgi:hypothetical protein